MGNEEQPSKGRLKAAFARAVPESVRESFHKMTDPGNNWLAYGIAHYPGKSTAITAAVGDVCYALHALAQKDFLGVISSTVGFCTDVFLFIHADPKITAAEKDTYDEPQANRKLEDILYRPERLPWESVSSVRASMHVGMLAGAAGVAGGNVQMDVVLYTTAVLVGYAIKMIVAEQPPGSISVPEEVRGLERAYYEGVAKVRENPNSAAGLIWNVSGVPFALNAAFQGDYMKAAFAFSNLIPNTFVMFSKKRAQVMDRAEPPAP